MPTKANQVYRFGNFRLDATNRLLYRDGDVVTLAPKVFDTLLLLATNSGQVLGKEEMMKRLWPDTFVEEGTLAQYISLLRKALGDTECIENHPRRGYRFTVPVEEIEAGSTELRREEQLPSPAPIPQEAMADKRSGRRLPMRPALVLLGAVVTAAAIWISQRPQTPKSFRSVAVLPFRTLSDSGNDYLADGITEALVTRLTNLKGLRVVSYSRVRRFKGSSEEAARIGLQLGVEAVIEGTVRVASGRVHVNVQGVDTANGYTIWAINRIESTPEKLLDMETQLAEAAAQRVRGQLTASERDLVAKSRTTNAEAYDLVLKARGADPATAIPMLSRAVQLDPEFADAYGWLSLAQLTAYNQRLTGPDTIRKAISNANQALSKDPDASIAIRALTALHHTSGREVEGLLMSRLALENSPDDLDVIAAAAGAYFWNGLSDRAIPLYEKALAGEPSNMEFRRQLARLQLYLGRYRDAIQVNSTLPVRQAGLFGMMLYAETGQMDKAVEIARGDPRQTPYGFDAYLRGCALDAAGDRAGAREIWANGLRYGEALLANLENPQSFIHDSMLYAKLGKREQALQSIQRSLAADPNHPIHLFFAAQTRSLLGLRREALDTLKTAVENGFFNLPMIEYHSRPGLSFHALRDDPQFHAIRADLGRRIDVLRAKY